MAGRGRGGKSSSLTQEQLQSLGCIGKDVPQVQTAPPPTFPPLMSKPVMLETTAAQNYQILWKEDFLNHMRDSPYYLTARLDTKNTSARHFSERFANAFENTKTKSKADFHWQLLPSELQALKKRRVPATNGGMVSTKKARTENIEDRLKVLEEKERNDKDTEANVKRGSDSENDDEEEEELAADEEMDDENDYGNSYFDNGEAYNEEDDNLDDGPIY